MLKIYSIIALALMATACSSTGVKQGTYSCSLDETNPSAACASLSDAYNASKKVNPKATYKAQSAFDPKAQRASGGMQGGPVNYFEGAGAPVPTVGAQEGAPVFKQPKVMRAWVAPYVDADGNLHSGEYSYFSTPGQWNYGTTKQNGAASGIYQPADPSNLGFDANVASPNRKAPATPSSVTTSDRGASNAAARAQANPVIPATPASNPTMPSADNITQPYQRLAN